MQDGALKVAGEILDRMAELKSFFNDVSKSQSDREVYNHEFKELQKELMMLKNQKFNGVSLFATTQSDNNPPSGLLHLRMDLVSILNFQEPDFLKTSNPSLVLMESLILALMVPTVS